MAVKKKGSDEEPGNIKETEYQFSKRQLLSCERFRERRDIVSALLNEEQLYTVTNVEEKITDYMKGKVE